MITALLMVLQNWLEQKIVTIKPSSHVVGDTASIYREPILSDNNIFVNKLQELVQWSRNVHGD